MRPVVRRLLGLAWGAWVVLGLIGGVRSVGAQGLAVVDDRGGAVVLQKAPARIVSLLPSLTESVCVLGACDRLVGVDRWSNWPEAVAGLPRLGGLEDPQVERIVMLKPDLVLLAPSSRVSDRLRALGLVVAELDASNLEQVRGVLGRVAVLLGQPQAGAQQWQRMESALQQVALGVPERARGQRVYIEIGSAPHAASAGSYIGQLLSRLGGVNVVPASLGPFPKLNPEQVVRWAPDVIIVSAQEADALRRRPGWSAMAAVRSGRVCGLSAQDMDVLARPGPRLPQAAAAIAHCLRRHASPENERQP